MKTLLTLNKIFSLIECVGRIKLNESFHSKFGQTNESNYYYLKIPIVEKIKWHNKYEVFKQNLEHNMHSTNVSSYVFF